MRLTEELASPRSLRATARSTPTVLRLCWRAGPALCLTLLAANAVSGLVPAAIALLTKAVVDDLAAGRDAAALLVPALGLAAVGLATAALPHGADYLQRELARRLTRVTAAALYGAVNAFDGLARFESPALRDRLRLAEQAGQTLGPATTGLFILARNAITVVSLLGALAAIAPEMAALVLVAGIPTLATELWLGRERTSMIARVSPAMRRRFFYSALLVDVQAAKEIRLFGYHIDVAQLPRDLPPGRRPLPALSEGIELRDVWFRYGDDLPWALQDVSLAIPRSRSVALVGLNGAGKTTLVKLLCRFYDPVRGAVLWDGVDIREVPVEELRARMGAVFQDFMAYDLTAGENIGMGDLDRLDDRERIAAAADRAGVADAIHDLARGYDTLLSRIFADGGDGGTVLSGGQWQRLALARAFMRDQREFLILDEPSSGLDAEAEHRIHQRLREHRADRTSLLISHRLGAVRDADAIVVLSKGRIVEQGRHDELIARDGEYARLFALQAAGYRAEGSALAGGT